VAVVPPIEACSIVILKLRVEPCLSKSDTEDKLKLILAFVAVTVLLGSIV